MEDKGWKIYEKVKNRRKEGRKKWIRGLHLSEENTGRA
jgi:hypothetical protein